MQIDEPDRIADDIGPEPGATADDKRIVHAGLHAAEPMARRSGDRKFVWHNEFVEQAIVHDQAHSLAGASVSNGEEAFARRIDLAEFGVTALQQSHKLMMVGREIHAAMD